MRLAMSTGGENYEMWTKWKLGGWGGGGALK